MSNAKAYAASSATSPLALSNIPRREPTDRDVEMDILYCGVCHSDLHQVRNEWSAVPTVYPCVPGHEIVGRVTKIGAAVTKHQIGDIVGVGCLVDSDQQCPNCAANLEQFCPHAAFTYNSPDKHGTAPVTYGGYSSSIVVDEHFALKVPANLDPAAASPLRGGSLAGGWHCHCCHGVDSATAMIMAWLRADTPRPGRGHSRLDTQG